MRHIEIFYLEYLFQLSVAHDATLSMDACLFICLWMRIRVGIN